jgi:hypothetical protein
MSRADERSAGDWFEAAERCYVQHHQGCARCGRQHCVLRSKWGPRTEYHCADCDFSVSRDAESGACMMAAGDRHGLPGVALGHADPDGLLWA